MDAQPRRKVLVVDDDLEYVRSTRRLLRKMGYEAEYSINATAALAEAVEFRPDIVLLDVGLPDGNGLLLVRRLRSEAGLASARIVCVTGRAEVDRATALRSGCDDHFLKPFDFALIEGLLASDRDQRQHPDAAPDHGEPER